MRAAIGGQALRFSIDWVIVDQFMPSSSLPIKLVGGSNEATEAERQELERRLKENNDQ